MPHISQLKESKFLTKADVGTGVLLTIKDCHEENVALPSAPPEMKWCLTFNEADKPMVLNSTNAQIIAAVTGSENTDDWTGHKIVLYNDPNISFQGKLTGGIRARAPCTQPKPAPAPAQPTHGLLGKPANRPAPGITSPPVVLPEPEMPLEQYDDPNVPF